jgi:hypothetical protein
MNLLLALLLAQDASPRVLPDGRAPADARLAAPKDLDGYFPFEVPATKARFQPGELAQIEVDSAGNVLIAEENGHRVWKIDPSGNLAAFAGTGQPGFSGDGGPADKAQLNGPWSLAMTARTACSSATTRTAASASTQATPSPPSPGMVRSGRVAMAALH